MRTFEDWRETYLKAVEEPQRRGNLTRDDWALRQTNEWARKLREQGIKVGPRMFDRYYDGLLAMAQKSRETQVRLSHKWLDNYLTAMAR